MSLSLRPSDHVVVVGAGLAGWRFAEALRHEDYAGNITLIGAEHHTPYDRPPLSKQVLNGKWTAERTELVGIEHLAELGISFLSGAAATGLDVENTTVELDDGREVAGTHVVIATGSRARRLSVPSGLDLRVVRTLEDSRELARVAEGLPTGSPAVVIGGGFIGAEVATALRARGLAPVVLEALSRPLLNVVGDQVAGWLERLPAEAGVELRVSQAVVDVVGEAGDYEVVLGDGSRLSAPLVVAGIGAEPVTEWLDGSGLPVSGGVVVDEFLLATERVGAIGDVARFRWRHEPFVEEVRIEHWQTANDHARHLAAVMTKGREKAGPLVMVPYFWSDQYGRKIQMLGHPSPNDAVHVVAGSVDDGRWLAAYERDGLVVALVALNQPRALMMSRLLLESHVAVTDSLALAPWSE